MNVKFQKRRFEQGFRKSVKASGRVATLPRAKGKDLLDYGWRGSKTPYITIDGVEYDVPEGYTLRDKATGNKSCYATIPTLNILTTDTIYAEFTLTNNGNRMLGKDGKTRCYVASSGSGTSAFCGKAKPVPLTDWVIDGTTVNTVEMDADGITVNGTEYEWASGTLAQDAVTDFTLNEINGSTSGVNSSVSGFSLFVLKDSTGAHKNAVMFLTKDSDGSVACYDFVQKVFYTVTGTFTAGSDAAVQYRGVGDKTVNEFNKNAITLNRYMQADGNWGNSIAGLTASNPVSVTEGESITVKGYVIGNNNTIAMSFFDSTDTILATRPTKNVEVNTEVNWTETVPSEASYMIANIQTSAEQMGDTWMIVHGDTVPDDYIPYGHKHDFLIGGGMLVKLWELNWSYSVNAGKVKFYTADLVGLIAEPANSGIAGSAYCSKYEIGNYAQSFTAQKDKSFCVIQSASVMHGQLWFIDLDHTDANAFKASLNGVYLLCQPATDNDWLTPSQYSAYTDEQLYSLYNGSIADLGDCTVSHDTGNMRTQIFLNCHSYTGEPAPMYIDGYTTVTDSYFDAHPEEDMICRGGGTAGFYLRNKKFSGLSAEEIKSMLTGVKIYYQSPDNEYWYPPYWDEVSKLGGNVVKLLKINLGDLTYGSVPYGGYSVYQSDPISTQLVCGGEYEWSPLDCNIYSNEVWHNIRYDTADNYTIAIQPSKVNVWIKDTDFDDDTLYPTGADKVAAFRQKLKDTGAFVLVALVTPQTKTPEMPTVKTVLGDCHFEVLTTVAPDSVELLGRSGIAD